MVLQNLFIKCGYQINRGHNSKGTLHEAYHMIGWQKTSSAVRLFYDLDRVTSYTVESCISICSKQAQMTITQDGLNALRACYAWLQMLLRQTQQKLVTGGKGSYKVEDVVLIFAAS